MYWQAAEDLAANLFAWLISEKGGDMFGMAVLLAIGVAYLIRWNRREREDKRPGMAGWSFIIGCFVVALIATGLGGYGLGVRLSTKETNETAAKTAIPNLADTPVVAAPTPMPPKAPPYTPQEASDLIDALNAINGVIETIPNRMPFYQTALYTLARPLTTILVQPSLNSPDARAAAYADYAKGMRSTFQAIRNNLDNIGHDINQIVGSEKYIKYKSALSDETKGVEPTEQFKKVLQNAVSVMDVFANAKSLPDPTNHLFGDTLSAVHSESNTYVRQTVKLKEGIDARIIRLRTYLK